MQITVNFAGVAVGTIVTIENPFVFDPAGSGTINPFWAFTSGGLNYSSALEAWTIDQRIPDFLELTGHGTVSITGFDPTPFVWALSLDQAGTLSAALSMSNAPKPVPEPGTLALLGLGLAGMGFASRRRKLKA